MSTHQLKYLIIQKMMKQNHTIWNKYTTYNQILLRMNQ